MARLIASSDGAWSGSVWSPAAAGTNNELDTETTSQALTTSNIDSSNFVLPAQQVDAILIKVASRAAGSPTNTITVTLRNTTTNADAFSVTLNVSDIVSCDTTERQGGWVMFKTGSPHTPNGTDNYAVRVVMNSTSTAVSLWRDSTTNNWNRLIRRTATTTPSAGDRFVITKEWTSAGTGTARAISYDITASTVWGSATGLTTGAFTGNTGGINAMLCLGLGGTLTWDTTGGNNYTMKSTGSIVIYSGGTMNVGTSGTPMPRNSTGLIEFVMTTSGDSKIGVQLGGTLNMYGLSRTSGKNVSWCLLNTDEAAAQTTLGVDRDTGWLSGDEVGIASTSRTASEGESRVLNGDAGASSIVVTVGLTNAHKGSTADEMQAEVVLLTRNIQIRSDNVARFTEIQARNGCTLNLSWIRMTHFGFSNSGQLLCTNAVLEYCSFDAWSTTAVVNQTQTTNTGWSCKYCVAYSSGGSQCVSIGSTSGVTGFTLEEFIIARTNSAAGISGSSIQLTGAVIKNCRVGGAQQAFNIGANSHANSNFTEISGLVAHSGTNVGINLSMDMVAGRVISGLRSWRNSSTGMTFTSVNQGFHSGGLLSDVKLWGNGSTNYSMNPTCGFLILRDFVVAGDTSFSTATGIDMAVPNGVGLLRLRIENSNFGAGGGTKTTHTSRDITFGTALSLQELVLVNTDLNSSTRITNSAGIIGSVLREQRGDLSLSSLTYSNYYGRGVVARETTTVHSPDTVGEKLTPAMVESQTLYSSPVRVHVVSGGSYTVTVWVRKDSSYNGSIAPRMIVKANPAVGIDTDTVLDTLAVAADTWEQLSASLPAVDETGKVELVVEVNGTAGNAFVGSWSVS